MTIIHMSGVDNLYRVLNEMLLLIVAGQPVYKWQPSSRVVGL